MSHSCYYKFNSIKPTILIFLFLVLNGWEIIFCFSNSHIRILCQTEKCMNKNVQKIIECINDC